VKEQLENPPDQGGINGIKLEIFDLDSFLFGKTPLEIKERLH
jgi:hypothetical protein